MRTAQLIPTAVVVAVVEIACSGVAFSRSWELDGFSR